MALASAANGGLILALIQIALYILLNPLPELVYQTRSSGVTLISESYNFIVENWLEVVFAQHRSDNSGVFDSSGFCRCCYGITRRGAHFHHGRRNGSLPELFYDFPRIFVC